MSHFFYYPLCCPSFMATHVCVSSESYVAVPLNERGNVAVFNINNPLQKPAVLIGHHKIVTALALSHPPLDHLLCSCSSDNIILWNLLQNEGNPTKGKVIHSHMELPLYCCFSSDNLKIAFSFSSGMWIFDLEGNSWLTSFGEIHFAMFNFDVKDNKSLGVEENVLKVWDLKTNKVETKVCVSAGFPSALCVHEKSGNIIVGTTCGHLNMYGKTYNLFRSIQVWKVISQLLKSDSSEEGPYRDFGSDSFPIYAIQVFEEKDYSEIYLSQVIYLLIVTSTCLFLMNINNEEVTFFLDFNDVYTNSGIENKIGLVRSASISCNSDNSVVYVSVIPVMGESLFLIKLLFQEIIIAKECKLTEQPSSKDNLGNDAGFHKLRLTFLNSATVEHGKSLLAPRVQIAVQNKSSKKAPSNLNLPVTFHSNIKSSGYGTLHKPVTLFQPQIRKAHRNRSQHFLPPKKVENSCRSKKKNIFEQSNCSMNYQNLRLLSEIESSENPVVSSLQMTVDGQYASCASSEGLIDILKLGKKNIRVVHTINAHKGEVNVAKWSHSKKLLVSGGKDKTAKIWDFEKQQPLLTIGVDNDNILGIAKGKFTFQDAVEQVQFYYLDDFILAAAENKVYLFDYVIHIEKSGLKGFVNKSSLKLVKKTSLDSKRITALAAMNQFFSICAGSSNCIDIMDMAVGKVVFHSEDVSTRPPYLISLNEGSPCTSQTPSMYDLFLTASLFDGIKIWDLRTNKPVLCYKEHRCRSFPCGAVFSPCGQYIATGSEDKSVYIYDLRQLSHVHKLTDQQIDIFTSVSFSPKSQLITSSLNGLIYLYGHNDN